MNLCMSCEDSMTWTDLWTEDDRFYRLTVNFPDIQFPCLPEKQISQRLYLPPSHMPRSCDFLRCPLLSGKRLTPGWLKSITFNIGVKICAVIQESDNVKLSHLFRFKKKNKKTKKLKITNFTVIKLFQPCGMNSTGRLQLSVHSHVLRVVSL